MAVFSYLLAGSNGPVGYVNSDFIVNVQEVKHRNMDGLSARVYLLGGETQNFTDDHAKRLLDWYKVQSTQDVGEKQVNRGGRPRKVQEELATADV